MFLDLIAPEEWEARQDLLRREFFPRETETWTLAPGGAAAVFENVLGLAQIYSHKRAVAFVQGNTPAFDSVVSWFLREAYQVQKKNLMELQAEESRTAWFDSLKKDTVLLLLAEDHPVTGELFDWDPIDRMANDKKIFVVRVSHRAHRTSTPELRPYSLRICSVRSDLALVGAGARFRVHPFFSSRWRWSGGDLSATLQAEVNPSFAPRDVVEKFENAFPEAKFFSATANRLYDRAVLCFKDLSGEALLTELRGLGVQGVETADLCRWNSMKIHRDWWNPSVTEEQLRGMMLISAEHLTQTTNGKKLEECLRQALASVRSRQEWT